MIHPHIHFEIARDRHRERLESARTARLAAAPRRERQQPLRPRLRHSLRHWAVAVGSLLVLVALAVTA